MNATDVRRTLQAHREILLQYGVQEVRVFGSTARGEAGDGSDIDLLVDYDPSARVGLFAFVRLRRRLSELLGCPVDLVTTDALHPALREDILREAVRVA
jgi:predicted nucleotidyltransferase